MSAEYPRVEDFLAPEEYPAWHPAAQGLAQDLPGESGAYANAQTATPYTGKASAAAVSSRDGGETAEGAEPARQGKYTRRRNPNLKKGFRKPPAKYAARSPFAPAIGAASAPEQETPQRKRSQPLFREGSALNEPISDEEMLIQGVTPMPEKRGRGGKELESEFTRAKNIVLNQLAASPKSRAMLEKKLLEKEISAEVIEDILNRFEAVNLINDAEFADVYVRTRMNVKKLSRSAIRRELKTKGVEGELAEIALEQRTEEDERADAHELVRKKLRPSMNLGERAEKEKVMRRLVAMLGRKGYPAGLAFSVVREEVEAYATEMGMTSEDSYSYYD
ncbi:regulatory protein RecX [Rothia nasimurium]|uniref:regulatory protein RecX n=1 Tax=Rothia nasimurium TaxID=85336 RepID=UPI001F2C9ED4|nr:regulatory protein RecX [Rothia nasimurium]